MLKSESDSEGEGVGILNRLKDGAARAAGLIGVGVWTLNDWLNEPEFELIGPEFVLEWNALEFELNEPEFVLELIELEFELFTLELELELFLNLNSFSSKILYRLSLVLNPNFTLVFVFAVDCCCCSCELIGCSSEIVSFWISFSLFLSSSTSFLIFYLHHKQHDRNNNWRMPITTTWGNFNKARVQDNII